MGKLKNIISISTTVFLLIFLSCFCFYGGFQAHKKLRLINFKQERNQSLLEHRPAGGVQTLVKETLPSVVTIRADITTNQHNYFSTGSGSIISEDGLILTNYHVAISGLTQGSSGLTVIFYDRTTAPAHVVGYDELSDLAIIKTDKTPLKPIKVGTSKTLRLGQEVIALGAPQFLDFSVSAGVVSGLDRFVDVMQENHKVSVYSAIQTDAAVNPGNSGGALIDTNGYLVGVNSAGTGAGDNLTSGVNFAITIDDALRIGQQLIKKGQATHATAGMIPMRTKLPPGGAQVTITPEGPAATAQIPNGAFITEFDGRRITTPETLIAVTVSYRPGDQIKIKYRKNYDDPAEQEAMITLDTVK